MIDTRNDSLAVLTEGFGDLEELLTLDGLPQEVIPPAESLNGNTVGAQTERTANGEIELAEDLKHIQRIERRRELHMLHISNAAKHIDRLPEAGEVFHCIMRGNYNGWDLVPAIARLATPATIAELWIATLSFNNANADELCEMLDAGTVGAVHFICSDYFKSTNEKQYSHLAGKLLERGQRFVAIRNHAKIQLAKLSDGRHIVIESSANLRSCRNIEQFSMCDDQGLFEFHAGWMDQVIRRATK